MEDTQTFTVIKADNLLGEGPLWSHTCQELLWIDGSNPHIWRWRWGADSPEAWPLPRPPAAMALLEDGRLLIAFRARMALAEAFGGPLQDVAMPGLELGEERFNDGKVDNQGRLWIGTIDRALTRPVGKIYRIDHRGIVAMDKGFTLSNGMAWSPDGATMYFSESFDRHVHCYRFDAGAGTIEPAGSLASFAGAAPKPDGLTVDAEGGIWCAVFGGSRVIRYLPDGTVDRVIQLPVTQPTSCMFGGPDLRTLFVTTATYQLTPQQLEEQPLAGSVLAFKLDVAGLPEPFLNKNNLLLGAERSSEFQEHQRAS